MNTARKLTKLITPRTAILLIVFCWNFTVLAQNDSTLCFTHSQVQNFLRTKVELENCLDSNHILEIRLGECEDRELKLSAEVEKKQKKLKRTRIIAGSTGGLAILFGLFAFLK